MTCKQNGCTLPPQRRGYCESHYRKRLRMGFHGWRDAAPVRAHLAALRDLGWTWNQIADAAGVPNDVSHQVGTGRTKNVCADSEQALLSVPLEPHDSHRGIDSTGTRRRIEALAWMGWSCPEVARRAGAQPGTLRTQSLARRQVSVALARRVDAVYKELALKPGPSKVAATWARKLGYAPPLAWDEGSIDDPRARPHGIRRDQEVAA